MCVTLFATFSSGHCNGVIFPKMTIFGGRKQSSLFLGLNTVLIIQLEKSTSFDKFRT